MISHGFADLKRVQSRVRFQIKPQWIHAASSTVGSPLTEFKEPVKSQYPMCIRSFISHCTNADNHCPNVQCKRKSRTMYATTHVRIVGVAKITNLNVQESADRTCRNYTKTAPAITPTTAAAMEPPIPLPMLLPGAPFPLKALGEADEEAPLEVPLEADGCVDVAETPEPVVLPVGLVREPDLFGTNTLESARNSERTHVRL